MKNWFNNLTCLASRSNRSTSEERQEWTRCLACWPRFVCSCSSELTHWPNWCKWCDATTLKSQKRVCTNTTTTRLWLTLTMSVLKSRGESKGTPTEFQETTTSTYSGSPNCCRKLARKNRSSTWASTSAHMKTLTLSTNPTKEQKKPSKRLRANRRCSVWISKSNRNSTLRFSARTTRMTTSDWSCFTCHAGRTRRTRSASQRCKRRLTTWAQWTFFLCTTTNGLTRQTSMSRSRKRPLSKTSSSTTRRPTFTTRR